MSQPSPLSSPQPWDGVAEEYVVELVPIFSLFALDAIRLCELPPRAHVLDVAAGPGTVSLLVAREVERVVAVDFSQSMMEILQRRAEAEGIRNVEARTADGQALPFGDGSFDGAFSMFGLMFFPDRAAGFRELHRVLKPGGRAVVSSFPPLEQFPLFATVFGTIHSLLPNLQLLAGKGPLAETDDFRDEMSAAGFGSVQIHRIEHRVEFPSVEAFWDSQTRSSAPVALLKRRLPASDWAALSEAMIAQLKARFGTGRLEVEWPANLGVGVR